MNKHKDKIKKRKCLEHRQLQYEKAIDGIIEGKIPPEYASKRWKKIKEVKKK